LRREYAVQATADATRVEQAYPSADVLPGNTLRLYIYFSGPVSRGEIATHFHVLDGAGSALTGVLPPGQELSIEY
jgi:hypothetical protein